MGPEKLYILVMGLTGAGKSTFIYDLTGNSEIPIGTASNMHRGTLPMENSPILSTFLASISLLSLTLGPH